MNALLYLIGAIVVSALAIAGLNYRQRRPKSLEAGIREFERGLRALDPAADPRRRGHPGPSDTPTGLHTQGVSRRDDEGSLRDPGATAVTRADDQNGREADRSG
jgi:hypothetical protein